MCCSHIWPASLFPKYGFAATTPFRWIIRSFAVTNGAPPKHGFQPAFHARQDVFDWGKRFGVCVRVCVCVCVCACACLIVVCEDMSEQKRNKHA